MKPPLRSKGSSRRPRNAHARSPTDCAPGVETSFADANKTLSQVEGRALSASEALRQVVAKTARKPARRSKARAPPWKSVPRTRPRGCAAVSVRRSPTSSVCWPRAGKKSDGVAAQLREAVRQAIEDAIGRFNAQPTTSVVPPRNPQGTRHDARRIEARRFRPSGRGQGKCRADAARRREQIKACRNCPRSSEVFLAARSRPAGSPAEAPAAPAARVVAPKPSHRSHRCRKPPCRNLPHRSRSECRSARKPGHRAGHPPLQACPAARQRRNAPKRAAAGCAISCARLPARKEPAAAARSAESQPGGKKPATAATLAMWSSR